MKLSNCPAPTPQNIGQKPLRNRAGVIIALFALLLSVVATTANALTYNTVHGFPTALNDGNNPIGALVQDPATLNYYGTTRLGGQSGKGTVFCLNHVTFAVTVLHSFTGIGTDGANPACTLIVAPGAATAPQPSTLYGTTLNGGKSSFGTVFKIATTGAGFSTIYSFQGGAAGDGANPFAGVIRGAKDGLLYGTTLRGGRYGLGTVYRINAGGTDTVLHHFFGTTSGALDGAIPYARLFQLSGGDLIGTTTFGGIANEGTVFRIATSGAPYGVIHFFAPGQDGANPTAEVIQVTDPATGLALLYGTTLNGGLPSTNGVASTLGTVYRLDQTGGSYSVVYSFGTSGPNDGAHPFGALLQVKDVDGFPLLYGATLNGGATGFGTVYWIPATAAATDTVLYSFAGLLMDGAAPYSALIQSSTDGLLYGTTYTDGAAGAGTAYQISHL